MTSTKKMEVSEFLQIMEDNADLFPEFAGLSQVEKENMANLNILTGPAEAFYDDGRLVGVGGIRISGVGESWLITRREIREKRPKELLRTTKQGMKKMCDENNLWRLYAIGKLSTNFLEHLGFETIDKTLVWSRKE